MSTEPTWAMLARYTYSYEAEFAATRLQEAEIPVLVKDLDVGIWGPGHGGPTTPGPSVWVPEHRLGEARDLLAPGGDVADPEGSGE